MGASYSTTIPGATERQKERYGVFSLRTKQKQSLVVLDDLIAELMSDENNIISLMKILKTDRTRIDCTDMFIVLSSTLKKEFQVLKFPDPIRPSETTEVAYMPKAAYDKKYLGDPKREGLCNGIAWFMVRLITLIFALTASLKFPGTISLEANEDSIVIPRLPINTTPLQFDLANIDYVGFIKSASEPRRLAYIKTANVIIDTLQGIVFLGRSTQTGIAQITIEPKPKPSTQAQTQSQSQPQLFMLSGYGQQPPVQQPQQKQYSEYIVTLYSCSSASKSCVERIVPASSVAPIAPAAPVGPAGPIAPAVPAAAPAAAPIVAALAMPPAPLFGNQPTPARTAASILSSSTNSSGIQIPLANAASISTHQSGGNKTRRSRRFKRRNTYKRRGGGLPIGVFQFTLRSDGMTKTDDESMFTTPFTERVEQFLNKLPDKFMVYANPFVPLSDTTREVIDRIQQISTVFDKLGEGASPAQYRAYLLASQTNQQADSLTLNTSFCKDIWRGKQATTVLAYALLDALFKDQQGNSSTTVTQFEYKNVIDQFMSKQIMKGDPSAGATTVSTFNELKFSEIPEELKAFCARPEFTVTNPLYQELLMNAHKSIRDLYDAHMQNVVQFITTKIISPKLRGYRQKPDWVLNPEFSTDARGAPALLESYIKEARTMIAKHYFAVESIYVSTIDKLKGIGLGLTPTSNVSL